MLSGKSLPSDVPHMLIAIRYCIPMDNPSRTFQRSEEKFFIECDTGHGELATSSAVLRLTDHS
jgi:hypothetical protein